MADSDKPVLTPSAMIADVRMQARFVREKTPMPERIAAMLEEVADEMEYWNTASGKDRVDG